MVTPTVADSLRPRDTRSRPPYVPPGSDPVDLRGGRRELAGRGDVSTGMAILPSARLDFTVQDYDHDEIDDGGVVQQRFVLATRTVNVLVRQAGVGALREGAWGVSALVKRYEAAGPAALTPEADSRTWGVFGFQELGLGIAETTLQAGARYDRYAIDSRESPKFGAAVRRTFHAFSGSIGVSAPLSNAVTASITGSRSFRAPTVEERLPSPVVQPPIATVGLCEHEARGCYDAIEVYRRATEVPPEYAYGQANAGRIDQGEAAFDACGVLVVWTRMGSATATRSRARSPTATASAGGSTKIPWFFITARATGATASARAASRVSWTTSSAASRSRSCRLA